MPCRYAAASPICDIVTERPRKQSWNASTLAAPPVFCMHTLRADSLAMHPEFVTKQCASRLVREASCTRNSANATLSGFDARFPCMQRSDSAPRSAAAIMRGSACPNMCTPIPLIMSHFTLPSASSTNGPLPVPAPR